MERNCDMRLIKFTQITWDSRVEECPADLWVNPEQVTFVVESSERPGCALIRLTSGAFVVTESPIDVVKKLRFGP